MHDHRPILAKRVERTLTSRIIPAEYTIVAPLTVEHFPVTDPDGIPGQGEPISREAGLSADYQPFEWPNFWGPGWGTTWFRFTCQVPEQVRGAHLELVLDLSGQQADDGPGFQAEGMVYAPDGTIIKAINPRNRWIPVTPDADGNVCVYVEAASNPPMLEGNLFDPTERGDKLTVGPRPQFMLGMAVLAVVNADVRELIADLRTLTGVVGELPEDSARRRQLEIVMDRALDLLDTADVPATAAAAREVLAPALASPAEPSAHEVTAVGHAHIDTAWLWPIRETRRKIARTFANVMRLIDDGEPLIMSLPAATHAKWMKEDYPDLYARVVDAVKAGKIVPVGGMWVEPDAVLPGAEGMVRQLVHGVEFFEREMDFRCRGVWLPDSFGYSGALPQLARLAGMDWFLTQKMSWNQVNKFPHHTFWWEGIDGSRIFTHFPPSDTYTGELSGKELGYGTKNFQDLGRANHSLAPFGYGDGGGGPTREMLAQAKRVADLEGSAKVTMRTPDEFFALAKADYPDAPVWLGELYLELHRGTFTSQAATKAGNRRNEALLHAAELWCTHAAVIGAMEYPYDELRSIWDDVLVGHFHDILPGSSIAQVHRENAAMHAELSERLRALVDRALAAITDLQAHEGDAEAQPCLASSRPSFMGASVPGRAWVAHAPRGRRSYEPEDAGEVTVSPTLLENDVLRVTLDDRGLVTSILDKRCDREVVPAGQVANLLQLHQDFPNAWDAWDVDAHYRHTVTDLTDAGAITTSMEDGVGIITVERTFSKSSARQELRLAPGADALEVRVHVDWHEQEKFLKLAFPLDVHSAEARFETQFGHITRATHTNTSWDAARFEVNAHRWVHVAETGYGVAIANERTYGWDVTRHALEGGATATTVRASLLRAARYPDPRQDQGEHDFSFLLVPGADVRRAVDAGYEATLPTVPVPAPIAPLVSSSRQVVVETVKLAEDRSGDVVLRVYEPVGARVSEATIDVGFEIADAVETDLLERPVADDGRVEPSALVDRSERQLIVRMRPFQVATLRLKR